MGWLTPYVTFMVKTGAVTMSGAFAWGQVPTGPFLVLVVIAVVALGVNKALGRRVLKTGFTLIPYILVVSTLSLCSSSMLWYVPSLISYPFYAHGGHPPWAQQILPHLPDWLMFGDEPGQDLWVRYLYEGHPSGTPRVPWGQWAVPLAAWLGMLAMIHFTAVCITGMFRRRWFHQEHITFPFAELALSVGGGPSTWATKRGIFREKLMWLGFAIPFLHTTLVSISFFVPGFPSLAFKDVHLMHLFKEAPWSILSEPWHVMLRFQWLVLGIAYLIPSQISIGTVFFFFTFLAQVVLLASFGATGGEWNPYGVSYNQSLGALIVFGVFLFYAARLDIRRMWSDLWSDITGQRSEQPHPDRWLLLGAIVGTLGLIIWAHLAGLALWVAGLFISLVIIFQLCMARLVAVLGMQHAVIRASPSGLLFVIFGTRLLGPMNLPSMSIQERVIWYAQQSSFLPMILQSHKIGDVERWHSSKYIGAMLIGGVVALLAYTFFFMRMNYQHGGLVVSPGWYFMYSEIWVYDGLASRLSDLSAPSWVARFAVLSGALIMWGLMVCHRSLPWWPFHPLGYLLASGYTSQVTWPGLLMGWTIKTAVSKYGGERLYFTLRPLFFGLLLGDLSGQAFWAVVCAVAVGAGWVAGG